MAKVKQVYGESRFVPWIGREVMNGEVVEVPDEDLPGYLEAGWDPADKPTTAARQKLWETGVVTFGAPPKPEEKPEPQVKEA